MSIYKHTLRDTIVYLTQRLSIRLYLYQARKHAIDVNLLGVAFKYRLNRPQLELCNILRVLFTLSVMDIIQCVTLTLLSYINGRWLFR